MRISIPLLICASMLLLLAGCIPHVAKVREAFITTRDNANIILVENARPGPDPVVIKKAALTIIKAVDKGLKATEGTEDKENPIVTALMDFLWLIIGGAVLILLLVAVGIWLWRRRWRQRVIDAAWQPVGMSPDHFPKRLAASVEKGKPT